MDRTINLLLVEGRQSIGLSAIRRQITDLELAGIAHPCTGSGLKLIRVQGIDDAAAQLRQGAQDVAADAILLDQGDVDRIGWLQMHAADLPILVVADDDGGDGTLNAIAEGAEDILLPADITGDSFRRRIDLAIARKRAEKDRLRRAREDPLTGLANDTLLEERFMRAMARTERLETMVGLVAIDLDGFDMLIAQHGQAAADRLLPMAGQRFLAGTRQTDTLARTRDHGFTWLVEGLASVADINALVNRLPAQLTEPFSIDGRRVRLTASVGVAIYPVHGQNFRTLLGLAEAAMIDVSAMSGDGLLMPPVPTRSATAT